MLIYIIPFFINRFDLEIDLKMAKDCLESLSMDNTTEVVIYNQGDLTNENLVNFLKNYNITYHLIGNGENVGIPKARNACLQYIWENIKDVDYIAEIHLDMILPPKWYEPLIKYLENTNEPMVSPRILYFENEAIERGFMVKGKDELVDFTCDLNKNISILNSFKEDKIIEGFVHPVIHKSSVLKEINPYDVKFLIGKQGFEDDSIILGYSYYLGLNNKWKPKINFNSCVYHKTLAQRMKLENINSEMEKNLNGLYAQYGAYGFKELYRIHNNELFSTLYNLSKPFQIFKY